MQKIQLGFCEAIEDVERLQYTGHRQEDWQEWDGGQAGGRPSWLHPAAPEPLTCEHCCKAMRFLCQIYAPLEASDLDQYECHSDNRNNSSPLKEPPDRAYHRSLYVFGCPSCYTEKYTGAIRVIRTQLPEKNPYYADSLGNKSENDRHEEDDDYQKAQQPRHLCSVCGFAATKRCPVQRRYFCSREHQKEYKRFVFDDMDKIEELSENGTSCHEDKSYQEQMQRELQETVRLPSVYTMTQLVVEEEPELADSNLEETTFDDDGSDDSDEDLSQEDLNKMVAEGVRSRKKAVSVSAALSQDPFTSQFYDRIKSRPNVLGQCLRYCRWPSSEPKSQTSATPPTAAVPLWLHKHHQAPATYVPYCSDSENSSSNKNGDGIPACKYCHAPRKFEFQLMPQMLHYLLQSKNSKEKIPSYGKENSELSKVKAAISKTNWILDESGLPAAHIPPGLVDARQDAVEHIKQNVLTDRHDGDVIDWGVVAIYTCVNSCGGFATNQQSNKCGEDLKLGQHYHEEFAWRQPSLDTCTED